VLCSSWLTLESTSSRFTHLRAAPFSRLPASARNTQAREAQERAPYWYAAHALCAPLLPVEALLLRAADDGPAALLLALLVEGQAHLCSASPGESAERELRA